MARMTEDFIFGGVTENAIRLDEFVGHSRCFERSYFIRQVNRYLRNNGQQLRLYNEDSHPGFFEFISLFQLGDIGRIDLVPRFYRDTVGSVLGLKLYLNEGTLYLDLLFTAYTSDSAHKLITQLILPIVQSGMDDLLCANSAKLDQEDIIGNVLSILEQRTSLTMIEQQEANEQITLARKCFEETLDFERCVELFERQNK